MFALFEFSQCGITICCDESGKADQGSLNLARQSGNDPSLVGLLRVYKNYYPEIVVGQATSGKAAVFKVRI
jgi:hypothetical protein